MKKSLNKNLQDALLKKAMGFTTTEVIEEYVDSGEGMVLQKKKVTSKDIPPDLASFKALIEINGKEDEFCNMTDEELIAEKNRLLKLLENKENVWKTKIKH